MRLSAISVRWYWLFLLGVPLTVFSVYFDGKGLSTGGDNLLHLYRLVALHKNIVEGNFFPRWTGELFLGFGYPLLNFYASSTYYLAELLHVLGAGYEHALMYAMLVLLFVASIGLYRLASDIFADLGVVGRAPALLATAAYLFAPYLHFNLYIRGAIAELGAQAILPWVLWSFRRLLCSDDPVKYLLWAILSLTALAFTHTISLLLVPPVLVLYALVLLWRYRRQPRELRRRIFWFAVATASAAAVSAVFWLPAIAERHFLTSQAQEAAALYLHSHTWSWQTFVDSDWFVLLLDGYGTNLRRLQLLLAIVGALAVRRWNGEWAFMLALAIISCLLVGEGVMSIWLNNPILLTVQFPWRLLGIASLPFALLTGGLVTRIPYRAGWSYQVVGLALLTAIISFVNFPRTERLGRLNVEPEQTNLTSISQYEAITGRYGLSASTFREFTPRWVTNLEFKKVAASAGEKPLAIALEGATAQTMQMRVAAEQPSRLLFTTLFFPGWQITLDDGQLLEPYPSSDFGLLTVDLPAGEHRLSVSWEATSPRRWGSAISLAALILLGIFCLRRPALRRLAFLPFAPLLVVAGLTLAAPLRVPAYYQTPDQPVEEGVQLLGYTTYQEDAEAFYLFPHWYVEETPTDLLMHWQLLDQAGNPVATLRSFPYFNTLRAFQWSANMVVDDGYYFPLPPGLAAGTYTVALAVAPTGTDTTGLPSTRPVGEIEITRDVPSLPDFAYPFHAEFQEPDGENHMTLRGYDVTSGTTTERARQAESASVDLTVAPGDTITYTLYWQSELAIPVGIQVFNQLLAHNRIMLTQVNQPLEMSYGPPYYLWNPYWVRENSYTLQIPEEAAGGLYQPYIGIYNLETEDRYLTSEANGTEVGDAIFLPPLKVARRTAMPLANAVSVQFGDVIRLEGYEVEMPSDGLQPQSTLTLTVQYKSLAPTTIDYTQFIHLHSPELGMAAQFDTPPPGNPTSTWIAGEVIVDSIPLQIGEGVTPGRYTLSMGLYDPSGGARLPVLNAEGQPQADNRIILEEIEIH